MKCLGSIEACPSNGHSGHEWCKCTRPRNRVGNNASWKMEQCWKRENAFDALVSLLDIYFLCLFNLVRERQRQYASIRPLRFQCHGQRWAQFQERRHYQGSVEAAWSSSNIGRCSLSLSRVDPQHGRRHELVQSRTEGQRGLRAQNLHWNGSSSVREHAHLTSIRDKLTLSLVLIEFFPWW